MRLFCRGEARSVRHDGSLMQGLINSCSAAYGSAHCNGLHTTKIRTRQTPTDRTKGRQYSAPRFRHTNHGPCSSGAAGQSGSAWPLNSGSLSGDTSRRLVKRQSPNCSGRFRQFSFFLGRKAVGSYSPCKPSSMGRIARSRQRSLFEIKTRPAACDTAARSVRGLWTHTPAVKLASAEKRTCSTSKV